MSFGKCFTSMYEGSMRGKGSPFFAVWGYIISHMKPNGKPATEMLVDLNPEIIAFLLGEKKEVVESKIREMCGPDEKSRTPDMDGRKLVKRGEYAYLVVNGLTYRRIRNEEERNEYQRVKQAEYRAKRRKTHTADDGRRKRFVKAFGDGDREKCDAIASEGLKP